MQKIGSDTLKCIDDSVFTKMVIELPQVSLFQEHELTANSTLEIIERTETNSGFIFLILLICIGILAYLQRNSNAVISSVFKAGFDQNMAMQDARVENSQRARNLFLLQLVSFISITLFIAGWLSIITAPHPALYILFLQTAATLAALYFSKRTLLQLLAWIFEMRTTVKLFRYNLNIFLILCGVLLLPLSAMFFFTPQISPRIVLGIGFVIIVFFYLKGLYRGLILAVSSKSVSVPNLFYYFCALEILPVFVLIRCIQKL